MEFYRDASFVFEYIEGESLKDAKISGSLQTLVLQGCAKYKLKTDSKRLYAIISSCWKYQEFLNQIIKKSGILNDIPKKKGKKLYSKTTIMLLVHDLLVSKSKRIQMGKHPIKLFILKHQTRLRGELNKLKVKLKITDLSQLVKNDYLDRTPVRWIRINTVRCQNKIDDVLEELYKKFPNRVNSWTEIKSGSIYKDEYIPNLYGIHIMDKITSHELYKHGKIIIQDRASCFPAHILNPSENDIIIDTCSAPGNKTTHVAAHIFQHKEPRNIQIYAFEKDVDRAKTLSKMIDIAGCEKGIEIHIGDFTKLAKVEDFPSVTGFIIDPSCSGSGIFGRKLIDQLNKKDQENLPEEQQEENNDVNLKERLAKLSSFQFQIIKHAMSFPNAKKLVYSTCSIYPEENERVVIDILLDKKVQQYGWCICNRSDIIPTWPRRGLVEEFKSVFPDVAQELADSCIRALPKEDGGIGFFAVCFERK